MGITYVYYEMNLSYATVAFGIGSWVYKLYYTKKNSIHAINWRKKNIRGKLCILVIGSSSRILETLFTGDNYSMMRFST